MAAQKTSLEMVLDKTEQEQQAISERLAKATTFVENERAQLLQLQEYEREYVEKIKEHQSNWSSSKINHYRSFCYKLNHASKTQEEKLKIAEEGVKQLRQHLYEQQHKMSVLADLIQQQKVQKNHTEDKRLQKDIDDMSNRRLNYSVK